MVKDLLGTTWNSINSLSVTFVLYILTYAYISAGSSIITANLSENTNTTRVQALFLHLLWLLWLSTRAVDRLSTILIGGWSSPLLCQIGGMISTASPAILFNQTEHGESQYLPYALAALPIY